MARSIDPAMPARADVLYEALDTCQRELCVVGRRDEGLAMRAEMLAIGRAQAELSGGPVVMGLYEWAAGLSDEGRWAEAADRRRLQPGRIVHPDRGSAYASYEPRCEIRRLGLRQSVGRTCSCCDNAAAESFFALLQPEINTRRRPTGPPHAWRSSPSSKPSTTAEGSGSIRPGGASPRWRSDSDTSSNTSSQRKHVCPASRGTSAFLSSTSAACTSVQRARMAPAPQARPSPGRWKPWSRTKFSPSHSATFVRDGAVPSGEGGNNEHPAAVLVLRVGVRR